MNVEQTALSLLAGPLDDIGQFSLGPLASPVQLMFSLICEPAVVVVKLLVVFPVPLGVKGTLPALLEKFPKLVHR